ncbi:MAG: hypothetical protein JNK05_24425 [Myxococcales bacterium]|nr:hypothetical protein [Myxococcales bacterium]
MTPLKWPKELDAEALFSKVFRPTRAKLDEARAATVGAESPREALERVVARGLCPDDWLDSPTQAGRAFGGKAHSPRRIPQLIETVTALASDVEGVLAAEELAREFLRRAGRVTKIAPANAPVFWRERGGEKVHREGAFPIGRAPLPLDLMALHDVEFDDRLVDALLVAADPPSPHALKKWRLDVARPASNYLRPTKHIAGWNSLAQRALRERGVACLQAIEHHRRAWFCAVLATDRRTLREQLRSFASTAVVGDVLAGVDFAALPNIFEPLAKLWWTGYALRVADDERIEIQLPSLDFDAAEMGP